MDIELPECLQILTVIISVRGTGQENLADRQRSLIFQRSVTSERMRERYKLTSSSWPEKMSAYILVSQPFRQLSLIKNPALKKHMGLATSTTCS